MEKFLAVGICFLAIVVMLFFIFDKNKYNENNGKYLKDFIRDSIIIFILFVIYNYLFISGDTKFYFEKEFIFFLILSKLIQEYYQKFNKEKYKWKINLINIVYIFIIIIKDYFRG
ncbi:hypothetical protein STFE110948_02455 [Streptobacillus felis]|uniref:hypothetical protein n=1 Tax=Streptobacillus felis TaxID=1384509 RepID=UPI00082E7257|nr:hypothetical protein [Streptobacillus felis]